MGTRAHDRAAVVVVEDDAAVRESLRLLLDIEEFPVACFASAQEFLDASELPRTGCMVLDVRLPGMSGVELHEALVRDGRSLPTVFLTGHGPPEISEAARHNVIRVLEKPCHPDALLEAIREAIDRDESGCP